MRRTLAPDPLPAGDLRIAPSIVSSGCAGLTVCRIAPEAIRPVAPLFVTRRIAPVSYIFQCIPRSNLRIAPDVILRLPGLTYSWLAPLIGHSVQTYRAAPGSRRLPHPSPELAANLRPSPETDLQLAHRIAFGSRRMLRALASPVTQPSARADSRVPPAKLATSPRLRPDSASFGFRRRPSLPCFRPILSPSVQPPGCFQLAPDSVSCGSTDDRLPADRNLVFLLAPASALRGLRRSPLPPVIPVPSASGLRLRLSSPARLFMKLPACAVCTMSCLSGDQFSFSSGCRFIRLAPDDQASVVLRTLILSAKSPN